MNNQDLQSPTTCCDNNNVYQNFKRVGPIEYTAKPNKTGPQGAEYENQILMLTFTQGYKKTLKYEKSRHIDYISYIGAEMYEVNTFEDVVYLEIENGKGSFYFLQSKYHTNSEKNKAITSKLLFMKDSKFSLLKYFEAAQIIKENYKGSKKPFGNIKLELQNNDIELDKVSFYYILFTSWFLAKDLIGFVKIDNYRLFFEGANQTRLFRIDMEDDNQKSVYTAAKMYLMANAKHATEAEIDDFMQNLIFADNQPSLEELRKTVETELIALGFHDMKEKFEAKIVKWKNNKIAECLHCVDYKKFIYDIVRQTLFEAEIKLSKHIVAEIDKHRIRFKENIKCIEEVSAFMCCQEQNEPRVAVLEYDHLMLTKIKIAQIIEHLKCQNQTIFMNISSDKYENDLNQASFEAFEYEKCNYIITIVRDSRSMANNNWLNKIFTTISNNSSKKCLLLIPHQAVFTFPSVHHRSITDKNNSFADICCESQNKLCKERSIMINNFKITLELLVDNVILKKIKGQTLIDIIGNDLIIKTVPQMDKYERENVREYYIPRQLYRNVLITSDITKLAMDFEIVSARNIINFNVSDFECNGKDVIIITNDLECFDYNKAYNERNANLSIHWIVNSEDKLYWQHTWGSLSEIRKHMLLNSSFNESYNPFNKRTSKANIRHYVNVKSIDDLDERVVVVMAEPGMGKSCLLSHLAETSDIKNTVHIIKTSFSNHKEQLKKFGNNPIREIDALVFLFQAMNFNIKKSSLEKLKKELESNTFSGKNEDILYFKIFMHLYENHKIAVLVDGYDEVLPYYEKQSIGLLLALQKTKVCKIWVTSNPYNITNDLMCQLNIIPYSLVPFSEEMQHTREFLMKFWSSKLELCLDIVKQYIDQFINKIEHIIFEKFVYDSVFVNIPQHLEMIATVYQDQFEKFINTGLCDDLNQKFNVYSLYTMFFEIKFEKCNTWGKDRIRREHGQLALLELFEISDLEGIMNAKSNEDLIKAVERADEKTGIVYTVEDTESKRRPRFVHRTFAQYFAADLLGELLLQNYKCHNGTFEKVRMFLYNLLFQNSNPHIFTFLNYKVTMNGTSDDIFNAALNGDIETLVEKNEIRTVQDIFGRTPLHHILYSTRQFNRSNKFDRSNTDNRDDSFSLLISKFNDDLFIPDDLFKWTALHYFAINTSGMGFPTNQLNYSQCNPADLQDIDGKTPLMLAFQIKPYGLSDFYSEVPYTYSMTDKKGNGLLHYFPFQYNISLELLETLLGFDCELVLKKNCDGVSPLDLMLEHGTRDMFDHISHFNIVEKALIELKKQPDKLVKLMSKCKAVFQNNLTKDVNFRDSKGRTALHHAATYNDNNMIEFLINEALVGKELVDDQGKTALHYAVENNSTLSLSVLLRLGSDVYAKDKESFIPAELLFTNESNKLLEFIDENLKHPKELDTLKTFLESMSKTQKFRDTLVAVLGLYTNIASHLIVRGLYDVNETDSEGKSALYFTITEQNTFMLLYHDACFNKMLHRYPTGDAVVPQAGGRSATHDGTIMPKYRDESHSNVIVKAILDLYESISKKSLNDVISVIERKYEKRFEVTGLKTKTSNMASILRFNLRSSENRRKSLMHFAVESGNKDIVKGLLSWGVIYNVPDSTGMTPKCIADNEIAKELDRVDALHSAVANGEVDKVEQLIAEGATVNARKFQQGEMNGMQPLHVAVQCGFYEIATILLEHGADKSGRTSVGDTLVHVACQTNDPEKIKFVINLLDKEEVQNYFLRFCNLNQIFPLERAAEKGHIEAVEFIINFLDNTYGDDEMFIFMQFDILKNLLKKEISRDVNAFIENYLQGPKWIAQKNFYEKCVIL